MYPNTPSRSGKSRSQRVAWATVLEFHSTSARSRISASPCVCRSVQYSWNQPTWPISQSTGLTMGSIGPINCSLDRSSVRRRVRSRVSRSCADRSSVVAPLMGRWIWVSFMRIVLITPVRSSSRSGNGTTSARWTRILRELGHDVRVANRYGGETADLMIALHAWRSSESIREFHERYPHRPLIVALSGTDINEYIDRDPAPTLHSLACADRLVALQELARRRVPAQFRRKVRVVHQSAPSVRRLADGTRRT